MICAMGSLKSKGVLGKLLLLRGQIVNQSLLKKGQNLIVCHAIPAIKTSKDFSFFYMCLSLKCFQRTLKAKVFWHLGSALNSTKRS